MAPACQNWTSDVSCSADVPATRATSGLVIFPSLIISAIRFSSSFHTSPRRTISLISGLFSYRETTCWKLVIGYLSPQTWIAVCTPSVTLLITRESSFIIPPDLVTIPTDHGLYNFDAIIFSSDHHVFPTRSAPATIQPTTDGPIKLILYSLLRAMISLVSFSGIPSATVNMFWKSFVCIASLITLGAVRYEAKFISVSKGVYC